MIIQKIQKFFKQFNQFIIKYKAGFFHIPYFANSPEEIVANFESMPFIDWDRINKVLTSNNPLVRGYAYFYKIEDGLWFHLSEVTYNSNVVYDYFYDKNLPANYHVISYNLVENPAKSKMILMNGVSFKTCTWNFCKPKANQKLVYFKGSTNKALAIYMRDDWAKNKLKNYVGFNQSDFNTYLESLIDIIIWQNLPHLENNFFESSFDVLSDRSSDTKEERLKTIVDNMFNYLIEQYKFEQIPNERKSVHPDIILKLNKIEKKLRDNLLHDFPGIDEMAKEFNISPTGLKQKFRDHFGESVYQYYLDKQLEIAMVLLKEKGKSVSEVAKVFKYANESKFSIIFKKKYGVLPSKVQDYKR